MPAQFLLDEGVLDTDLLGPVIIVSANTAPDTPGGDEGGTTHGFVQPYFPPVIPPQEIKISTIYAGAVAGLGAVNAQAMSEISFFIMEDDAEVLLLI